MMKYAKRMAAMATMGWIAFGANSLQAQPALPMNLNVKLTVLTQDLVDQQVGTSPVYKSTIMKMKVTSKDLLSVLEVAYTNADFTGDALAIDDNYNSNTYGDFIVVDPNGNVVKDPTADGFFNNFYDTEGEYLYKGSSNDNTGSDKYTDFFTNVLQFNDMTYGNHFDFKGLEQWNYSFNGKNNAFSDSFKLNGAGSGSFTNAPGGGSVSLFLLSGSVSGKVKGQE